MYAECPNCHAIFRVTPEILAKANGKVRCGECQTVFVAAVDNPEPAPPVVEYVPPANALTSISQPQSSSYAAPGTQPPDEDLQVDDISNLEKALAEETELAVADESGDRSDIHEPDHRAVVDSDSRDDIETSGDKATAAPLDQPDRQQPRVFADEKPEIDEPAAPQSVALGTGTPTQATKPGPGIWHNTTLLALLSLIALGLLAAQYLYKSRYELSQVPSVRPALEAICTLTGCDLPPRVAISKLELLNHGIYSHPNEKGALMIKAVIVNHASFAQPLPIVELSLSNIRGEKIALRRFGPSEYLPETDKLDNGQMQPETQISISLQVKDPGKDALAFEFEFL